MPKGSSARHAGQRTLTSNPAPLSSVPQNLLHDAAGFGVGDAFFLAVVEVEEFRVIEAEEVKQRGVIIVRADRIHDRLVPELVGFAVGHAALDPAAREPTAEPLAIVIAPGLLGRAVVLGHRKPADLAAPMDDRGVEQAARLEVLHQRGGRLICLAATIDEVLGDALVVVPDLAVDEELHETDAALDETAGDQATRAVFARDGIVQAVKLLRGLAFSGQIERLLRRSLHPRGEFVAGDARFQVRFAGMTRKMAAIEAGQESEILFLPPALQMRRRFGGPKARLGRAPKPPPQKPRPPPPRPTSHPP